MIVNDIWNVIADLVMEVHPDSVFALAERLATLESFERFKERKRTFEHLVEPKNLDDFERAWSNHSTITPKEIAVAIKASSVTAGMVEKRQSIDMVWTGPSTTMVPSRRTEQVFLEVLQQAKSDVFIVSFVAYKVERVIVALKEAINRGVKVSILFESTKSHGGKIDIDSLGSFSKHLPQANFYFWASEDKEGEGYMGSVHAKCVVADGKVAFITSANLTSAALERNMELGVLIEGGNVPDRLHRHLQALATTGVIEKIQWTIAE